MRFKKNKKTILTSKSITKLHGFYFEDLKVGMEASYIKTFADTDVKSFSNISGDTNPIHLNHDFASETLFKGKVIHGMLTASLISTVIGTKLPGPGCIYVEQELRFKAPVRVGDIVTAFCKVKKIIPDTHMIKMYTRCTVTSKVVLEGEATILVPIKPGVLED
jgi:3-hydroxybutyryl-CoA dehydratase